MQIEYTLIGKTWSVYIVIDIKNERNYKRKINLYAIKAKYF